MTNNKAPVKILIYNTTKDHTKINILEGIEIFKATSSQNLLNDIINGRSNTVHTPPFS